MLAARFLTALAVLFSLAAAPLDQDKPVRTLAEVEAVEQCVIENVTILARDGFAGIQRAPAPASGTCSLTHRGETRRPSRSRALIQLRSIVQQLEGTSEQCVLTL